MQLTPEEGCEHGHPPASNCEQISGTGNRTMITVHRDKGDLNDIQKVIYRCPEFGHRACPVAVSNGPEHHTIQYHDDTEPVCRSDAEHDHHDFKGSGSSAADAKHNHHNFTGSDGSDAGRDNSDH